MAQEVDPVAKVFLFGSEAYKINDPEEWLTSIVASCNIVINIPRLCRPPLVNVLSSRETALL